MDNRTLRELLALQEESFNDHTVAATGVFPGTPQQQYNPYSNSYNPGWRDQPNLRWGQNQNQNYQSSPNNSTFHSRQSWQQNQNFVQQPTPSTPPPTQPQGGPSLEELVKQMATNSLQFQQITEATIQNLQTQIGQLATIISQNQLQASNNLPSQIIPNPNASRENVSVITSRSDEQTMEPTQPEKTSSKEAGDKEKDVGDNKVQFNLSDVMQYPTEEHSIFHFDIHDETIDDMHNELLNEPLHDKSSEFEFTCSDCTNKTELCAACHEIAEFLNIEHDDAVDFNVEHDLYAISSETAMSLRDSTSFDSIGCDNTIVGDCLQIAGAPSIQQQSPALEFKLLLDHLKYAFDFNEDCKKAFDQPKKHLTSGPTLQSLHWEFPFELIWMLWLQKFNTKIKDRCGAKRKLQLQELEELILDAYESSYIYKEKTNFMDSNVFPYGVVELNDERTGKEFLVSGQRLKHYYEGLLGPMEEQDILLTDAKYPP